MFRIKRNLEDSQAMMGGKMVLLLHKQLVVRQRHEIAELFGYETRNKYEILDTEGGQIAFAAEQNKGIFNFLFRQYFGHWRKFDVNFFTPQRELFLVAHHPFRFFFERIEVRDAMGIYLGAIQKRWAFLSKKFDLEDDQGRVFLEVSSPFWRLWTFTFKLQGKVKALVKKKWSGILFEAFTDKDTFLIEFMDPTLNEPSRRVVLASAIFIDLSYFERKG
jgi:uncharacterized protein YxjI